MKRIVLIIAAMMMLTVNMMAQNFQEVVYLKNGSIIKGTVIEQVPGKNIRIQTSDGSIFAYSMDDVERIVKEPVSGRQVSRGGYTYNQNSRTGDGGLQTGYRGFFDMGYNFGVGEYKEGRVEMSTTHGSQVLPMLYVGAGVGVSYWFDSETFAIPIFGDFRINAPTGAVSPFLDVKMGYSPFDIRGIYGNFSLGCRFATGKKGGINLSVGYQLQRGEVDYYYYSDNASANAIAIKLGFDF
ncbi:MAG: hypothetical protein IJ604_02435 [Prevotella sp.]|nr:hypothetical protein [Prevotella sp.]